MKIKSKVLIYAPNIHTGGGIELLKQLVNEFDSQFDLNIDFRSSNIDDLKSVNVNYINANIFSRLFAEWKLRKQSSKYDVILCFSNLPPLLKLDSKVVLFLQNKLLISDKISKDFPFSQKLRLIIKRLWLRLFIKNVNRYVVQTDHMKEAFYKSLGKNSKVMVCPFYDFVKPNYSIDKTYDFIYIASGDPHKNHKTLINAWVSLAKENCYPILALTLDTNKYKSLIEWCDKMRIEYGLKIINLGWIKNKNKLINSYFKSRAMIYPSKIESFSIPLIEANEYNIPIIASELDYVRDVCNPVETFNPNSAKSISRSVKRFLGVKHELVKVNSSKNFLNEVLSNFKY